MYLIAIAWMYVVLMMAVAEAMAPQGTVLGAFMTLLLYGVGPLALLLYILGTPHRRRQRKAAEAAQQRAEMGAVGSEPSAAAPDGRSQPAGDTVPTIGKEV